MYTFEAALADKVVRQRAASVAVGTKRHARMVGGLHRHTALDSRVRCFRRCQMATSAAGERPNPRFIVFVTRRALSRRS